jgi:hypothetical protein
MPQKEVQLGVAAFLDSPHALALGAPDREDVKRISSAFLAICYDELGKAPNKLDGHDMHVALGHALPGRMKRKDPLAEHVPAVLGALVSHLEESYIDVASFELRNAIEATREEFLETVRTGHNAHHLPEKQEPLVHKARKLGRNDPCSCGSGKKFKKCHGKG